MKTKSIISCLIVTLSLSGCISRLQRHALYGTVVDIYKKPIANCTVGKTKTDSTGYFFLPEVRYNQFFLSELLIMEAPPVTYTVPLKKEGFETSFINYFHKYGGGIKKGAIRNLDTIYLKRNDQN